MAPPIGTWSHATQARRTWRAAPISNSENARPPRLVAFLYCVRAYAASTPHNRQSSLNTLAHRALLFSRASPRPVVCGIAAAAVAQMCWGTVCRPRIPLAGHDVLHEWIPLSAVRVRGRPHFSAFSARHSSTDQCCVLHWLWDLMLLIVALTCFDLDSLDRAATPPDPQCCGCRSVRPTCSVSPAQPERERLPSSIHRSPHSSPSCLTASLRALDARVCLFRCCCC